MTLKYSSASQPGRSRTVIRARYAAAVVASACCAIGTVSSAFAQGNGLDYVKWTEPKEGSFSVQVPQGWTVNGGLFRLGPTDVRQCVAVDAPDKTMSVLVGDPGLPTFATLAPIDRQMGRKEGDTNSVYGNFTETYMHYMSGKEFNRWFLANRGKIAFDNVKVTGEKDMPQIASNLEAFTKRQLSGGKFVARVKTSAAIIEFTGTSKETGRQIDGAILSTTQLVYNNDSDGGTWHANLTAVSGDEGPDKAARINTTTAIAAHLRQTWTNNPEWMQREQTREAEVTAAAIRQSQAQIQAVLASSHGAGGGGGASGGGSSSASMSAYWRHNAERAEQQHQFINYLRDEKDAVALDGSVVQIPDR